MHRTSLSVVVEALGESVAWWETLLAEEQDRSIPPSQLGDAPLTNDSPAPIRLTSAPQGQGYYT